MKRWLLATLFAFTASFACASDGSTVNAGANANITAHGVCRKVTNNSPTGLSVYIPTLSANEWSSFYTNPPAGVSIAACAPTCSGVSVAGYCWYAGSASVAQSCTTVCSTHGGTTDGTINYTGSAASGGAANCRNVAIALGGPSSLQIVYSGNGQVGCAFNGGTTYGYIEEITTQNALPPYEGGVFGGQTRRVCSCVN